MDFFPEISITDGEAELIALGLFAVARADGQLHDRELALVQSFYGELVEASVLRRLEAEPDIEPSVLAAGLTREPLPMLFLKTAILCAHADGTYHDLERARIAEYGTALEVGPDALPCPPASPTQAPDETGSLRH